MMDPSTNSRTRLGSSKETAPHGDKTDSEDGYPFNDNHILSTDVVPSAPNHVPPSTYSTSEISEDSYAEFSTSLSHFLEATPLQNMNTQHPPDRSESLVQEYGDDQDIEELVDHVYTGHPPKNRDSLQPTHSSASALSLAESLLPLDKCSITTWLSIVDSDRNSTYSPPRFGYPRQEPVNPPEGFAYPSGQFTYLPMDVNVIPSRDERTTGNDVTSLQHINRQTASRPKPEPDHLHTLDFEYQPHDSTYRMSIANTSVGAGSITSLQDEEDYLSTIKEYSTLPDTDNTSNLPDAYLATIPTHQDIPPSPAPPRPNSPPIRPNSETKPWKPLDTSNNSKLTLFDKRCLTKRHEVKRLLQGPKLEIRTHLEAEPYVTKVPEHLLLHFCGRKGVRGAV
jgi:hypothetical protein